MHSGDSDTPRIPAAGRADGAVVVVATLAAIVLAGSAYVYRARQPRPTQETQPLLHNTPEEVDTPVSVPADETDQLATSASVPDSDAKDGKRSKDRRRRGKDPVKEMLKNGKKLKALSLTPSKSPSPSHAVDELDVPDYALRTPLTADFDHNPRPPSATTPRTSRSARNNGVDSPLGTPKHPLLAGTTSASRLRGSSEVSQSNQGDSQSADDQNPHPSDISSSASVFESSRPALPQNDTTESDDDDNDDNDPGGDGDDDHVVPLALHIPHSQTQAHHHMFLALSSRPGTLIQSRLSPESHFVPSPSASVSSSAAMTTATNFSTTTPATSPALSHTSTKLSSQPAASTSSPATISDKNPPLVASKSKKRRSKNTTTAAASSSASSSTPGWEWDGMDRLASTPSSSTVTASATQSRSLATQPLSAVAAVSDKKNKNNDSGLHTLDSSSSARPASNHDTPNPLSSSSPYSLVASQSQPDALLSPSLSSVPPMSASLSADASLGGSGGAVAPPSSSLVGVPEQEENDDEVHLVFPTLNPPPAPAVVNTSSGSSRAASSSSSSSSRRAGNTRRPPTPSRNTPSPHSHSHSRSNSLSNNNSVPSSSSAANGGATASSSSSGSGNAMSAVSAQTQLASLRGALEAARQREEKNKADLDKVMKEIEVLKWENMNWRRGDAEHQAQVRQLTHQIHTYASYLAMSAPHLGAQIQAQAQAHAHAQAQAQQQHRHTASGSAPQSVDINSASHNESGSGASSSSTVSSAAHGTPDTSASSVPWSGASSTPDVDGGAGSVPGIMSGTGSGGGAESGSLTGTTPTTASRLSDPASSGDGTSTEPGEEGLDVVATSMSTGAQTGAESTQAQHTQTDPDTTSLHGQSPAGSVSTPTSSSTTGSAATTVTSPTFPTLHPLSLPHPTTTPFLGYPFMPPPPATPHTHGHGHPHMIPMPPYPHPMSPTIFGMGMGMGMPPVGMNMGMTSPTSPTMPPPLYGGPFGMPMVQHPQIAQYQAQSYQRGLPNSNGNKGPSSASASASASASSNGSGPPSVGSMSPDLRGPLNAAFSVQGALMNGFANGNGNGNGRKKRKGRQGGRKSSVGAVNGNANGHGVANGTASNSASNSNSSTPSSCSSPSPSSIARGMEADGLWNGNGNGLVPSTIGEEEGEERGGASGLLASFSPSSSHSPSSAYPPPPSHGEDHPRGDSEDLDDQGDEDEDEASGVSEFLVDAIFKRPDSIGRRSGSNSTTGSGASRSAKGVRGSLNGIGMGPASASSASDDVERDRDRDEEVVLTELVFPSLSDIGNVKRVVNGNGVVNGVTMSHGGGGSPSIGSTLPVVDEEGPSVDDPSGGLAAQTAKDRETLSSSV